MKRVLILTTLLYMVSCGISQDQFENITGVWKMDSLSCFTKIGDVNTQEVWATAQTVPETNITLGITGRNILMTASSASCPTPINYSLTYLFTERDGLREGQVDYQILTSNLQNCVVELNYFNGVNVDPGIKYTFDILPVANQLYNNYFQRADDNTLLLKMPANILGSADQACAGNCECYGAFLKQ